MKQQHDDMIDALFYVGSMEPKEDERTPEEKLEDLLLREQPEDMGPWTGGMHWDGENLTVNGSVITN